MLTTSPNSSPSLAGDIWMDVPSEAPSSLPQHTPTHQGILPASVGRAAIGTSTSRTISKVFCSFLHPSLKKNPQQTQQKKPHTNQKKPMIAWVPALMGQQ